MSLTVISLKSATIAKLNDQLRSTLQGGQIMITAGVNALPDRTKANILSAVRHFNDFTEDNDPHGEHDFGAFEHGGTKFFWKIDYYAPDMEHGSEDPTDPAKTMRVLTIMRADEY